MPFSNWTARKAADSIPDKADADIQANVAFAAGDHWQGGNAWIGPMLPSTSDGYQTMLDNVERTFVPQNAIGEIVGRHVAGVIGDSPQKHMELQRPLAEDEAPSDEEAALLAEARALLSAWWSSRQGFVQRNGRISRVSPHGVFQEAVRAMLLTRRGPLRLVIPASLLSRDEDGETAVPANLSIEDAMGRIHIQHPQPAQATLATDKETLEQAGIYTYKNGDQAAAEIVFVDEDGRTVIRIVQNDLEAASDYGLQLDGRLTMYEMERSLFVDDTKRRLQKALNLARTSESRNIVDGGFLERLYLNTQMPGTWEDDDSAPGGRKFVPAKVNLGPNTANFLQGLPIKNEHGQVTGYATPSVVFRDPTSAETFVATADDLYQAILHEASQVHVLAGSASQVSGEFIIQARADFETSLKVSKTAVDAALAWCFDTVLALAAAMAGRSGYFDRLKVSGSAVINTGPLSISERELIVQAYKSNLLSQETAVRLIGAENVSAEIERINREEGGKLSLWKLQAEVLKLLTDAGANLNAAAMAIGVDEENAARLAQQRRLLPTDNVNA